MVGAGRGGWVRGRGVEEGGSHDEGGRGSRVEERGGWGSRPGVSRRAAE